jgi:septal ring-binding cell division protein DamX
MTRASGGLSRRINLIADKALLAAFAESTHNVNLAHVKAAVRDSEFSDVPLQKSRSPMAYALVGLAIGGALGIAAFAAYLGFSGNRQAAPSASESAAPPQAALPAAAPVQPVAAPVVRTAAPVPASPAAAPSDLPPDLLEQRLLATAQWLQQENAGAYSIQLLGSPDAELLREYFKTIAKYLEIEKVYVYRTVANQRPSFTVLYGTYVDRDEVTRVLESLPPEMRVNRPYTRTIQGIRAEIAYQNRS